jgi:hypothetical protein
MVVIVVLLLLPDMCDCRTLFGSVWPIPCFFNDIDDRPTNSTVRTFSTPPPPLNNPPPNQTPPQTHKTKPNRVDLLLPIPLLEPGHQLLPRARLRRLPARAGGAGRLPPHGRAGAAAHGPESERFGSQRRYPMPDAGGGAGDGLRGAAAQVAVVMGSGSEGMLSTTE